MSIPKLKAAAWVDGEPLTPTQINQLNDLLPNLMDMVGGSTHTPAAKINVFGPEGMHVDTLEVSSAAVGTLGLETALTGNGSINVANSIKGNSFALNAAETPSIAIPLLHGGIYRWDGPSIDGGGSVMKQTNIGGSDECIIQMPPLPRGCSIVGATATIKPAASHAALPATMPFIQLEWLDPGVPTWNAILSQLDTSATVGAYDTLHTIAGTISPHVYDCSKVYRIRVRGESGANAALNGITAVMLYGLTVQISGTGIHL